MKVDAFSPLQSVFLSEMDQWGINTFFTHDTAMGEYTPEIADQLFYWPLFVDTTVFHDYGENKNIPVLFVGNCYEPYLLYQWRKKMRDLISKYYPLLIVPHPGYDKESRVFRVYGEQYARLINASFIAPTCGGMCKHVVLKHLEIPAAKACLIAEKTDAVEIFGFVDMENCIFADEHDILDKLYYLLTHRDVLKQITQNGYDLVHARHTAKQRPQILQWLQLYKMLKPGQRIVQTGLFEDLKIVDANSEARNSCIISGCVDRVLLQKGDKKFLEGKYHEAESLYLKCLDYAPYMSQPKLRIALCKLYQGDAITALDWVSEFIKASLGLYKASDPDPVEWAYLIITLVCQGKLDKAAIFSRYFLSLRHIELDRARFVVHVLNDRVQETEQLGLYIQNRSVCRKSIHQLPEWDLDEYINRVCFMLKACRQHRFSRILADATVSHRSISKANACKEHLEGIIRKADSNSEIQPSISYVLESLEQIQHANYARKPLVIWTRMVKNFISRNPSLKRYIKSFVFYLHSRVQALVTKLEQIE